jgi:hypothetical protein
LESDKEPETRMAKPGEPYQLVVVESFRARLPGYQADVHVRPVAGQGLAEDLLVECPQEMIRDYPVGTRFRIKAKLTDREGGGEYLYTSYRWKFDVLPAAK